MPSSMASVSAQHPSSGTQVAGADASFCFRARGYDPTLPKPPGQEASYAATLLRADIPAHGNARALGVVQEGLSALPAFAFPSQTQFVRLNQRHRPSIRRACAYTDRVPP